MLIVFEGLVRAADKQEHECSCQLKITDRFLMKSCLNQTSAKLGLDLGSPTDGLCGFGQVICIPEPFSSVLRII